MHQQGLNIALVVLFVVAAAWLAAGQSGAKENHSHSVPPHSTLVASPAPADKKADSVASLVIGLEQRLEREPDDGKGWLLLAKSYRHLGRMDDARDAYRKADDLGHGDARVAAQLFGLAPAQ